VWLGAYVGSLEQFRCFTNITAGQWDQRYLRNVHPAHTNVDTVFVLALEQCGQ